MKPRIARACRGYLTAIEKWDEAKHAFVPTVYSDSLPLIWSYYPSAENFDTPQNVPRCIDVVRYVPKQQGFDLQIWSDSGVLRPSKFRLFLENRGTFQFTVLVSADDVAPERIPFRVTWDGENWPPHVEMGA